MIRAMIPARSRPGQRRLLRSAPRFAAARHVSAIEELGPKLDAIAAALTRLADFAETKRRRGDFFAISFPEERDDR